MMLYDASAFFELLKQENLSQNCFLLDLSFYEIGNILWKHTNLLKQLSKKDSKSIESFVTKWENIIRIEGEADFLPILDLATEEKITFYDSAYIYFAKKYSIQLLTCDKKLYKTARKRKVNVKLITEKIF